VPDLIDFDVFRAEHKEEPLNLKIGGKVYDLPAKLPAMFALDIVRLQTTMGGNANVPATALEEMGVSIFGAENFRTIVRDNRLTVPELSELIQLVMRRYSGVAVTPPNRKTRRESKRSVSRS